MKTSILLTRKMQKDAAVAYFAAFARNEDFDIALTFVKGIPQGYDDAEFEDRAVGFLSPLRYESGKPITIRKYRQGRRS